MFNGKEIEGSTNKRDTEEWLPGKTGRFSLHIKNVSENDIGEYNCRAEINNFYSKDSSEASIRLQLYESGMFNFKHLYTLSESPPTLFWLLMQSFSHLRTLLT